ncbi:hypothetical protein RhiirC2_747167 [Rhizophagus irregularis]|uniref:Uncharacterized protein n=1 Tax=Rhizophagus irregularis TaxID=588596 RepID=A0A2N1N8H1_9GLOM|nr:hypothetical protein RhiirC2_747167 [Rhizophagus irregularis]
MNQNNQLPPFNAIYPDSNNYNIFTVSPQQNLTSANTLNMTSADTSRILFKAILKLSIT